MEFTDPNKSAILELPHSHSLEYSVEKDNPIDRFNIIHHAVDKVYDLIRERLVEIRPEVQKKQYFDLGIINKEDIYTALDSHAGGHCKRFDMKVLDCVSAGILTRLGFGKYCCDLCGAVFSNEKELDDHLDTRFREPFICFEDGCERQMCCVDAVKMHCELIHGKDAATGKKKKVDWREIELNHQEGGHKCDETNCGRRFKTSRGLATHKRMVHKESRNLS